MQKDISAHRLEDITHIARHWQQHPVRLRRILARYECNEADVQDIIQEALVVAVRCADRYEGKSSLETWLTGIALNVARNHVGAAVLRSRRTVHVEDFAEHLPGELTEFMHASHESDPAASLHQREFAATITKCVADLPDHLQRTFELLCVQDYSYEEAAEELAVPVGTVRSRLHRTRQLLKEALLPWAQSAHPGAALAMAPAGA